MEHHPLAKVTPDLVCLFMAQNVIDLDDVPHELRRTCVLLLLHEVVSRCLLLPVDWCVVELSYGLTDFLPNGPVLFL